MKEEVRRIMKLVEAGKLSAEDAMELIEAMNEAPVEAEEETAGVGAKEAQTPPHSGPAGSPKDPFTGLIEGMERLGKDISQAVNWPDIAKQIKSGTQKGVDALSQAVEQARRGKGFWNLFGPTEVKKVTLPLPIREGQTLKIENPTGDIRIYGAAAQSSLSAEATVRGSNQADAKIRAENFTLVIEESESFVRVRPSEEHEALVDFELHLALSCPIELKCSSGEIWVEAVGGPVRIESSSGGVRIFGADGLIEIHTASGDVCVENSTTPALMVEDKSGDIVLREVSGSVTLRTASGSILAEKLSVKTASIEAVSGPVAIDLLQPVSGSVNVRSVNGPVKVSVPDGCDCRVALSSIRGLVSCGLELDNESRLDQHITGRLGEGSGSLDVSTVTGDIILEQRDARDTQ